MALKQSKPMKFIVSKQEHVALIFAGGVLSGGLLTALAIWMSLRV